MLFNSIEYFFFLPTVFIVYWFLFGKNIRAQNLFILICSYIFYGWWDWRFLSLIFLSTVVDFFTGIYLNKTTKYKKRKNLLLISIVFNLSLLGFFKYYNFFINSWIDLISNFGYEINSIWTLKIILPVGISFYTFQTMSYSIDIFNNKMKPTKDFISFAAFVSFFPQLVAGPIERASNLLPQILNNRKFKFQQGVQGLRLIIWGMFKKVVIADSLAPIVDHIFSNYQELSGGILLLGLIYFSFQIYCDFSGYSDIAIGTAKLFGIEIMSNFKFPYFSKNIEEFWSRWHISLSSWFRDYIYIPLFNKIDDDDLINQTNRFKWHGIKVTLIVFMVSGLWHGANWTFIVWGLIHSILYLPIFLLTGSSNNINQKSNLFKKIFSTIKPVISIGLTFFSTTIAWAFFRSNTVIDGFKYIILLFSNFSFPTNHLNAMGYVVILLFFDFIFRHSERLEQKITFFDYFIMPIGILIIIDSFTKNNTFIYFQF